ncbi:MAG: Tll0287-like domain-containing protein [Bacteroidales bacterium]
MRNLLIFLLIVIISSCSGRTEKSAQNEIKTEKEYLQMGMEIANQTQAELLKVVSGAMASGGPVYAIEFCNLKALDLKDSLSHLYNCEIERIALKNRNPEGKPDSETEWNQLESYQQAHAMGDSIGPELHVFEDRVEYYQPILIKVGTCLVCHGDPETQIAEATLAKINELYPEDRATGFAMNDLRGAWKITFP